MFFEFLNFLAHKILFFCGSIAGDCFPKPLSPKEEQECIEKYRNFGDLSCKEKLIKHNLRLVAHIAKKYETKLNENDDLISIGTIGLIKAIDSYSLDKIIPELGYVKGNVWIISNKANAIKSNASLEELKLLVKNLETHWIH